MKKKFYLTTPIFYPNGVLHLGHAYTLTLADVISRFKSIDGYDVFLQTGSDEHGEKILKTAISKGLKPIELVDANVEKFKALFKSLNVVDHYYFMRTSFLFHEEEVKNVFKKLLDSGDVYKGSYEGNYCVTCEEYSTSPKVCSSCSSDLIKISEDCFFMKVEKYREKLIDHYKSEKTKIFPQSSSNELFESFLNKEMPDLCITRRKIDWGIKVPENSDLTLYVWFDALCSYMTSPYGKSFFSDLNDDSFSEKDKTEIFQVIGKDIIRFHFVYWPIILLSLGKRLPNTIFSHGWILHSGFKMSKSKGNVVDPTDLIEKYGSDTLRSFLCSKINIGSDGNLSEEKISEFYNDFFVNKVGNLFSRTCSMIDKYFSSKIPFENSPFSGNKVDFSQLKSFEFINLIEKEVELYKNNMRCFDLAKAFGNVEKIIVESNKFISHFSPWKIFSNGEISFLSEIIVSLVNSIKVISFLMWPFAPQSSENILSMIGLKMSDVEFSNLVSFSQMRYAKLKKFENHLFMKL